MVKIKENQSMEEIIVRYIPGVASWEIEYQKRTIKTASGLANTLFTVEKLMAMVWSKYNDTIGTLRVE